MSPILFLDTNIPVYAAGRPHQLKDPCAQILSLVAQQPTSFVTDAEVLQELLHRYLALRKWTQARIVFEQFVVLMRNRVEPILSGDVERAAGFVAAYPAMSARDLLHTAVIARIGADYIVTADHDFDAVPNLQRLDPADVAVWQHLVAPSTHP
jgi:uncharacterized protein